AWTYSVEGKLVGAPHTEPLVDFRREDYGLHSFRTGTWGGFVWANLDDLASDLPEEMGEFFSRFRRFAFEDLRLGARKTYEVEANWKILGENYSECYHCAPIHADVMKQPDFDPSDAVDLWDLINRQDWSVCERTQKGTHSRAWKGGRFSAQESQVHDFERYVAKRMRERIDAKRAPRRQRRTRGRQGSRHRPG